MGQVYDRGIRIEDLGDGLVLGVVFPGQLQVRRRELELALSFELGAQAVTSWRSLGYCTGECRRLSAIRKWPLRLKTYENGPESYDSRPFSIACNIAQRQLASSC